MTGDHNYELDPDGKIVLIGLTAAETAEFIRLDEAISIYLPNLSTLDWPSADERRWLTLYEKHDNARRPFLAASKTRQ
jgi:hypothetical protein